MVTGEISRSEYDEVLMPPIRELIENGGKVRAVCQIGPDFHGYDKDADWEDVKRGAEWGIGPHDDWHRIAVVTDEKKLRKATRIFGWLAPGEARKATASATSRSPPRPSTPWRKWPRICG